tara:strand:- start:102 stop:380 length:279 start_codon:yes stop_codon:yes gene_type:complete
MNLTGGYIARFNYSSLSEIAIKFDGEQSLLYKIAVLHTYSNFLANVTPFLKVDTVQFVESSFERKRFFWNQIVYAVGDAQHNPPRIVFSAAI